MRRLPRASYYAHSSAIALYGLRVPNGANGWYTVDDAQPVKFSWAVESGGSVSQVFKAGGLDAAKNHTLFFEIQQGPMGPQLGTGRYVRVASVDFFAVSDPLSATDTPPADAAPTAQNDFLPAATPPAMHEPGMMRKCSGGAVVASFVVLALAIGGALSLVRHIRRRYPRNPCPF